MSLVAGVKATTGYSLSRSVECNDSSISSVTKATLFHSLLEYYGYWDLGSPQIQARLFPSFY